MRIRPPEKYYAVYLRKTDQMICSGTSRECAKAMGRSVSGFWAMVSKVRSGRNRKYEVYVEPLEEAEV